MSRYPATKPRKTMIGIGDVVFPGYAVKHKQSQRQMFFQTRQSAMHFYRKCASAHTEEDFISIYKKVADG